MTRDEDVEDPNRWYNPGIMLILLILILIGYGSAGWGFWGGLTPFVAGVLVKSGLVFAKGADRVEGSRLRFDQLFGFTVAISAILLSLYGGWTSGWAWALLSVPAGLISLVIGMFIDATIGARARAEQAQREQVERYSDAFEEILREEKDARLRTKEIDT